MDCLSARNTAKIMLPVCRAMHKTFCYFPALINDGLLRSGAGAVLILSQHNWGGWRGGGRGGMGIAQRSFCCRFVVFRLHNMSSSYERSKECLGRTGNKLQVIPGQQQKKFFGGGEGVEKR